MADRALKDFIATQADPAHCKSASFAAAAPSTSHTGLVVGAMNMGPKGFTPAQQAQINARMKKKAASVIKNT